MATLSLSYPEDLKKKLQARADADGRSLSNYIVRVLNSHLGTTTASKSKSKVKRSKK
jgi:plasmid stability protein